ncbi:MAG: hypothetical protein NVS2B9_11630 [Myxococcales bacterium]
MAGTPLVLPVEFVAGAQVVQAMTREISLEGAFVRCAAPPAVGARLALKLFLPGFPAPEEIRAVVRARATSGEAGFWAHFVAGPAQSRERVAALISANGAAAKVVLGALGLRKSGPDVPLDAADFARPRAGTPADVARAAGATLAAVPSEGAPAAGATASTAADASPAAAEGTAASGANRRVFPRYDAKFAVRFATVQDFVLEYAANISAGGVFVHTQSPPEMDEVINVTMELPGGGAPVDAKAMVVHRVTVEQARTRNTLPGVGVQFTEMDDNLRQRIDRAIEHILKDGAKGSM